MRILVRPAGEHCNLACPHCFQEDHRRHEWMSEETLRRTLRDPVSEIFFSGGEATLRGLPFYRLAQHLSPKAEHHIQTNALLITEEWVEFFAEHGWIVGLSHDGPYGERDGSHAERVAPMLAEAGVEFEVLCTVSKANVAHGKEILQHFAKFCDHAAFIPVRPPQEGPWEHGVTGEEYRAFLDAVAAESHPERSPVSVRNFIASAAAWKGYALTCEMTKNCGTYMVVSPNGDLHACDFLVRDEWRVGSVYDERPLFELFSTSRTMREFRKKKRTPHEKCGACDMHRACNMGCPASRFLVEGDWGTLDPHCEGRYYAAKITKPR